MIPQLPLAVSLTPGCTFDDFVPGSNVPVLSSLRQLAAGAQPQLFLSGPPASGKSHLLMATLQQAQAQGRPGGYLPLAEMADAGPEVLEDLHRLPLLALDDLHAVAGRRIWEEALFHLFNRARDAGTALLFAADRAPARLPLTLPDLRSRLTWGIIYALQPLDDAGRRELLLRQARRRGLQMHPRAADWMVTHCSRDPRRLLELLERLDHASLAARRPLTLPFVREQLR